MPAPVQDVQAGRLKRLEVLNMPPLYADMAVVSLKGRTRQWPRLRWILLTPRHGSSYQRSVETGLRQG